MEDLLIRFARGDASSEVKDAVRAYLMQDQRHFRHLLVIMREQAMLELNIPADTDPFTNLENVLSRAGLGAIPPYSSNTSGFEYSEGTLHNLDDSTYNVLVSLLLD